MCKNESLIIKMYSDRNETIHKICGNIATSLINSILEQKAPGIRKYFSDYPNGASKKESDAELVNAKKSRIKKEKVPIINNSDELNSSKTKRIARYSGSYNVEEKLTNLFEEDSESIDKISLKIEHPEKSVIECASPTKIKDSKKPIEKVENLKKIIIRKKKKKLIHTLSETSSEEEEIIIDQRFPICLIERCDSSKNFPRKLLKSSKQSQTPEKPPLLKLIDINQPESSIKNTLDPSLQPVLNKPQKGKDCKALKSIFQNSSSFDDAMRKYAETKREFMIAKPKIIPAPVQNPDIKKKVKAKAKKANGIKTDESISNQHLGGIFTINNGWDKEDNASKKIEEETENKKESVNKLERHITPPNIVIDQNNEDVMAAHEEFMYNNVSINNLSFSSDSDSSDNLKIALSNENLKEADNSFKYFGQNSSLKHSEDESDNEKLIQPAKKVRKLFESDDEDELNTPVAQNENDATNVISLFAEAGEFDDLDDENDPFYSEVDDLKIKVQRITKKVEPLDDQTEFDINSLEISKQMVDPETDRILIKYFGNVCPGFLRNSCTIPACKRNHFLLDESRICPLLINASFDVIQKVYQVALNFRTLFQAYITIFVQICIKNKDDTGLAELVKACDRMPRTIICYKDIVRTLIQSDYMKEHRAISFIIAHHTDSDIARDTILSLIIDSGPCIAFFMDYIEKVHLMQPIRSDMFSRILHTCVAYQNPKLPNFCLNYLQGLSATQLNNLNSEHLKSFLLMNKCISQLNENREMKAFRITKKILSITD